MATPTASPLTGAPLEQLPVWWEACQVEAPPGSALSPEATLPCSSVFVKANLHHVVFSYIDLAMDPNW